MEIKGLVVDQVSFGKDVFVIHWSANTGWGDLTIREEEDGQLTTDRYMANNEDKEFLKMVLAALAEEIDVIEQGHYSPIKPEKKIKGVKKQIKKEIVKTMVDWNTGGCPEGGHRCSKCDFKYTCDKMAGLLTALRNE